MMDEGLNVEEARGRCPSSVLQVDWEWHIDNKWTNTSYQEKCLKNAQNRSHQTITYSMGSRAFVPARHSMVNPESNVPIGFIEWWKQAHTTKSNQWCCMKAGELQDEMVRVRSEPTPDGHDALSEDAVGMQVLGRKSGYVRGMGHGPKPPSMRHLHCSTCASSKSQLESVMQKLEQMEAKREAERNLFSRKFQDMETQQAQLLKMFEEFRSSRTTFT